MAEGEHGRCPGIPLGDGGVGGLCRGSGQELTEVARVVTKTEDITRLHNARKRLDEECSWLRPREDVIAAQTLDPGGLDTVRCAWQTRRNVGGHHRPIMFALGGQCVAWCKRTGEPPEPRHGQGLLYLRNTP